MLLKDYLSPVNRAVYYKMETLGANQWGSRMFFSGDDEFGYDDFDIAIMGIETQETEGEDILAADVVRRKLYQLYNWNGSAFRVADLGNIKRGADANDVYFAIRRIVTLLNRNKIIPIIIGGKQDLTYGQFMGHTDVKDAVNVVMIDEKIDLQVSQADVAKSISPRSFLYKMLTEQPKLDNFTQIGFQKYLVDPAIIDTLEELHFECHGLGDIRADLEEVEPLIRNADLVSFDLSALRQSDAPGVQHLSPSGFWGEEACRICRYAGMSDTVSSIGFYEYEPALDQQNITAIQIAQLIWYFVRGYYARKFDHPDIDHKQFLQYIVNFKENDYEITFFKSRKSDRWWMKVPTKKELNNLKAYRLVPCSYKDYETACKDEIPDRWMKALLRLGD